MAIHKIAKLESSFQIKSIQTSNETAAKMKFNITKKIFFVLTENNMYSTLIKPAASSVYPITLFPLLRYTAPVIPNKSVFTMTEILMNVGILFFSCCSIFSSAKVFVDQR